LTNDNHTSAYGLQAEALEFSLQAAARGADGACSPRSLSNQSFARRARSSVNSNGRYTNETAHPTQNAGSVCLRRSSRAYASRPQPGHPGRSRNGDGL